MKKSSPSLIVSAPQLTLWQAENRYLGSRSDLRAAKAQASYLGEQIRAEIMNGAGKSVQVTN